MSIDFINSWILPEGFEGPSTRKASSSAPTGWVSPTASTGVCASCTRAGNAHGQHTSTPRRAPRKRPARLCRLRRGTASWSVWKVAEMKFLGKTLDELAPLPQRRQARVSCSSFYAAREVVRRNHEYAKGLGAPVTAIFNRNGITVFDPYAGPARIYTNSV